jgi:hypothetical protein
MATLQQHLSVLRSGSIAAHENRGAFAPEPRPYLVTFPYRKAVKSTQHYLALFPHESEDARLTGATRSLYRRLLALNLPKKAPHAEPASVSASNMLGPVFASNSKAGTRIA